MKNEVQDLERRIRVQLKQPGDDSKETRAEIWEALLRLLPLGREQEASIN